MLIWLGLCIQCGFLLFILFTAPEPSGHLKIALQELQSTNLSDLPPATFSTSEKIEVSQAPDLLKSPSANLVTRLTGRLSTVNNGYWLVVRVTLLVNLLNIIILILLSRSVKGAVLENWHCKTGQKTGQSWVLTWRIIRSQYGEEIASGIYAVMRDWPLYAIDRSRQPFFCPNQMGLTKNCQLLGSLYDPLTSRRIPPATEAEKQYSKCG